MTYPDDYSSDPSAVRGTPEPFPTNRLGPEDEQAFSLWQHNLAMHDPRANNKGLALLVRAAMNDETLRSALLHDTAAVLRRIGAKYELPGGLTLHFHENTPDTLHVVLPPRAGEIARRAEGLSNVLRISSSTDESTLAPWFDNFNRGNLFDPQDSTDEGDRHSIDG
ncbi:hypothetical protein NDR87_20640 [Nocardia sp. CDC159]|uniref:Uncharacterized protein n=1 Tax=Nocardia pulmonis TaxID=2951408 RepID=A0A9X2EBD6_9NOCA|nr:MULTISPECIES: hypothetical protein [Nocardia]MCM6776355.1 hypothetical protein [Nocardia pulmonis]MCM6788779.1 hypothetical protein [Nocardia sp. CDC159]